MDKTVKILLAVIGALLALKYTAIGDAYPFVVVKTHYIVLQQNIESQAPMYIIMGLIILIILALNKKNE